MNKIALITGDRHAVPGKWQRIIQLAIETHDIDEVIHGAARGIDSIAAAVATLNVLPVHRFPADWKAHGKAAGPIRNAEMLRYLQRRMDNGDEGIVLAFHPGLGQSRGTRNMVEQAQRAGIPVVIYDGRQP